ncbi:hypothetical protein IV38_GL001245 [Lactobacillus selangorensis]|uniref:HTH-type transcriptional regulator SarZ n=1 Tax=Lactobacillus selangorensis TaxID=81857 RepID=A0A0R2FMT7_9LACO|nr:MarR family transcriptional regulator [Lactobacillus selangorensis]KRN29030.1 hypothetical protein IV38_GL001245 [Lactobacillus selangorensis]KRN32560.1 hypothetical protein IV40_GL000608 [Lactobacillus selangorensis]
MADEDLLLKDQLCFAIYKTAKEYNRFYAVPLKKYYLTYVQYITLLALWEHDHSTVNDLGKVLELDSGTLTPLLKLLEKRGWLTRERSRVDERKVIVSLTPKAKKLKPQIMAEVSSCLDNMGYSYDEIHQLITMVDQINQRVKDAEAKEPHLAEV